MVDRDWGRYDENIQSEMGHCFIWFLEPWEGDQRLGGSSGGWEETEWPGVCQWLIELSNL